MNALEKYAAKRLLIEKLAAETRADIAKAFKSGARRGMAFKFDAAKSLPKGPTTQPKGIMLRGHTHSPEDMKKMVANPKKVARLNMLSKAINRGMKLTETK